MAGTGSLGATFDRVMARSLEHRISYSRRVVLAAAIIVIVAVVRAVFITDLLPWLLFIPAILVVALLFGKGAGGFAVILSATLAAVTIGSPAHSLWLAGNQWLATFLFAGVNLAVVALAGALRASFRRAADLNQQLADREAFLASVLAASTDCIKVVELDGSLSMMSEGGMRVMEISDFNEVAGCPWESFWESDENPQAIAALQAARLGLGPINGIHRRAVM